MWSNYFGLSSPAQAALLYHRLATDGAKLTALRPVRTPPTSVRAEDDVAVRAEDDVAVRAEEAPVERLDAAAACDGCDGSNGSAQ